MNIDNYKPANTMTSAVMSGINNPPVIISFTGHLPDIMTGGNLHLTADASDPDGDMLMYDYTIISGGGLLSGSTTSTEIFSAAGTIGNLTVDVIVNDGKGG